MTPARTFPPELLLAAQGVQVAFFDVDGVMTDGGILYSDEGETLKRFHTLDGLGKYYRETVEESPAEPVDVVQALRDSGVHAWHIWRDGLDLFHVISCDDWDAMESYMAKLELTSRWYDIIHPLLDLPLSQRGPLPLVWALP